jgi:hypothetical protein
VEGKPVIKSGLRFLFESTRQWFATYRSTIWRSGVGADPTWSITPTGEGTGKALHVEVLEGGTVGEPGIIYRTSADDGVTWGDPIALGNGTTITLAFGGGILVLSLSGAVVDGERIIWTPQPIAFAFGELEPPRQEPQGPARANRIVFVPGQGPLDGPRKLGPIVAPRGPGDEPRPLGDLLELFQIYCWSWNPSDESSEAQHDATLLLFTESLWPALYAIVGVPGPDATLNYMDDASWQKVTTRAFGRELVSTWTVRNPMPNAEYVLTHPHLDDTLATMEIPTGETEP